MKTTLLFIAFFIAMGASAQLTTIYDIQGQTDVSPYEGQIVTTSGVVTSFIRADGFIIQDGETPWNGLYVYYGANAAPTNVQLGDEIEVMGEISEYFGLTELTSIVSTNVVSSGNTINPILLTTQQVNQEQYESMLVRVTAAECVSQEVMQYGEYEFNDGSGVATVDDKLWSYNIDDAWVPVFGTDYDITGIVSYSFDLYRLYPRDINDVIESSVETNKIEGLSIYPNPVSNGVVYISANSDFASVNIYNMVGQQVYKTENIDKNQTSINVSNLSQGVYILKIETINGKINTHKITVK